MTKKGFLKAAAFLLVFAGIAEGAFAQVTISGGFALSSMEAKVKYGGSSTTYDGDVGVGGNIYADYLLPISVPLSLGLEIGVDTASVSEGGNKITGTVIPLLLRAAYHFDLMPKLDLYGVGKIGVAVGSAKGDGFDDQDGFVGVGFGFDIGAAYYFIPRFGIFVEAGFDRYNLKKEVSISGQDVTVEAPFNRFFTIGISTKF
jgi:hypothetical protein